MSAPARYRPAPTTVIRLALGVIYLHFGALKLFPDLSSAELLAEQTILRLGLGLAPETALTALACFECGLGLLFLLDVARRFTLGLFAVHLLGTLLPLFVLPELMFRFAPFAPTLEGQYILKNAVFAAAGWALLIDDSGSPEEVP